MNFLARKRLEGESLPDMAFHSHHCVHHYQISTLTHRSRGEELTARKKALDEKLFHCHTERKARAAAKKLLDGKSVIRETRNDVIRISSRS